MRKIIIALTLIFSLSTANAQTTHYVVLTWTASPDSGVMYNVYRTTAPCSTSDTFTKVASAISTLTYTDNNGITVGSTYCYYVTATLGGLESVPSNQAPAVILPGAPASVTVTVH